MAIYFVRVMAGVEPAVVQKRISEQLHIKAQLCPYLYDIRFEGSSAQAREIEQWRNVLEVIPSNMYVPE